MKSIDKIVPVDPFKPAADAIDQAAAVIVAGGVVVIPTQGLYGLAADAFHPTAVKRIFSIKGRPQIKPLLVLIADPGDLQRLVRSVSGAARYLMKCFWPGKLTIVMPARADLAAELTAGTRRVGVRQTAHPVAAALVEAVGRPLTGTSANLSGAGGCFRISDIDPILIERVDLVLDCGTLAGGSGSTVVDVCEHPPTVLREGAVPSVQIMECFKRFAQQDIDKQS